LKLQVKHLGIESGGKPVITLSMEDAEELGVRSGERVRLFYDNSELTAIANIVTKSVPKGIVGIYDEVSRLPGVKSGQKVDVETADFPESLNFIQNKLKRRKLNYDEILQILKDAVRGNLSEAEVAAYVTALDQQGLDLDEATSLTVAMAETGRKLDIKKGTICDKHSIGGVPGDKSTLLVVPIIAAAGLIIPKTSSRAITSAAGTADRAEAIMPVRLGVEEMRKVVEKANGCIVWGGTRACESRRIIRHIKTTRGNWEHPHALRERRCTASTRDFRSRKRME
jgi:AMP phosphorylase